MQRCLLNIENDVEADDAADPQWRDWKWMKNYRVWEANRKVFMYPENWIEPELRDDKTPFFQELEDEILQNELTSDHAENILQSYLEKLDEVARLEAVLGVRGPCPEVLCRLENLARSSPALGPAVAGFARRLDAMGALGIDVDALAFEAEFGRTTLEYYDGFVFGAVARARPDLPPVASGGRYDALTRVLGGGRSLPAVGGILRPEALVALIEGAR